MEQARVSGKERGALWASSAALVAFVVLQAPGRIVPETKLDVTMDPLGYLSRTLSAWDPSAGFGRIQNQAVGYLFPMGAFSALTRTLGVPAWLGQRLWIAAVLVVALWGAHRVARAVGTATPHGRLAAALAYALAPATLSVVAFQSAGQLPYALAPWVLVPLLTAAPGDHPRRVAARSALAVAAMGGVNGASALAVLPLAVVWFATRAPGRDRRRLAAWWSAGVVAATLWWLIPLMISVRYGVRFTEYTESASLTTISESGTEILRGTGNWLSFLRTDGGMWLPGGWALSAQHIGIIGSVAVAAGGLAGLTRDDAPERRWLAWSVVAGVVAMGAGYAGPWSGSFSGLAQGLLDGPLAPFRNVHKFSAVARLPLALGLGHLVASAVGVRAPRRAWFRGRVRIAPAPVAAAAAVVVIVCAMVPTATRLTAPGSFEDIPPSWQQAGAWLDTHQDGSRALVLPGSAFGEYRWGRPLDEPLAVVSDSPWAVRDLIPLGGNGSTRLLDGIDTALQGDALPPGFTATLQRAGVRYMVVRNDLDLVRTGGPRPATVRRLLRTDPALTLVASFGPARVDQGFDDRLASPPGQAATEAYREVDIWEVPDPTPVATAYPLASTAMVSGGPEGLLSFPPDLLAGRATVLSVDRDDQSTDLLEDLVAVGTDSGRRRDVMFGAIRANATYTLTETERSPLTGEAPSDRWPADAPVGLTTSQVQGAATLSASGQDGRWVAPEGQPFAAFDGNAATSWTLARSRPGAWIDVGFDAPRTLGPMRIRIPRTFGKRVGSVTVTTDAGTQTVAIERDGTAPVELGHEPTSHLRITVASIVGTGTLFPAAISEISVEGLTVTRPLVVPDPGGDGPDALVLTRDRQDRFHRFRRDEDSTIDRIVRWDRPATVTVSGTASAAPGPALDELLARVSPPNTPGEVTATASTRAGDEPAFSAGAAIDGDPLTAWVSDEEIEAPTLELRWQGAVLIDGLTVRVLDTQGTGVGQVRVTVGEETYDRTLTASGEIELPTTTTDHLELSFPPAEPTSDDGADTPHRVAVAEVTLPSLLGRTAAVPDRAASVALPCGSGPPLEIDGEVVETRADATVAQLHDGLAVAWESCVPVSLEAGTHRIRGERGSLVADTVAVHPEGGVAVPQTARATEVLRWDREDRSVRVAAGEATVVATTENYNDGWRARANGETLEPVRVDGWRQGWILPAGDTATIELTYGPGTAQRAGLAIGLVALLALVAVALVPRALLSGALVQGDRQATSAMWTPPEARVLGPAAGAVGLMLAVAAGVALGGPLVAAVALAVSWRAARGEWLSTLAASAAGCAGVVALVQAGAGISTGRGTFSGPAQALATLAVVAVALSLAEISPGAGSIRSIRARFARRGR